MADKACLHRQAAELDVRHSSFQKTQTGFA
jgi:hypothetical protein